MKFKKSAVSYIIWIFFIMCNCVVFAFLSMMCARLFKLFPVPLPVGALVLSAAFFGVLLLLYLLTGWLGRRFLQKKFSYGAIAEGIVSVLILALGIGIRIYLLPQAGETASYYDVAKVTQESVEIMVPVQNSVYYYILLLRGLFVLVGNHWIAGIWMQMLLQFLGCVLFYFAVRKIGGAFVALGSLMYVMISPVWIGEALNYSPRMLYFFVWSMGLLFVALYFGSAAKRGGKELSGYRIRMWLGAVLLGMFIGFTSYIDVSGMVLLVPILFLPAVCEKSKGIALWLGRTGGIVFLAIGSFFACLYLDSVLSHSDFAGVFRAWMITYQPGMPNVLQILQNSSVEVFVLLILMSFNIFAFCRRKDSDIMTPWILTTIVLAVLYMFGITAENMNGRCLLLALMEVVGVIGIRELFYVTPAVEEETAEGDITIEITDEENKEEAEIPIAAAVPEKPRFIENPLPLPKKHVKKVMDYAISPSEEMMTYDVAVSDTDDFDIS